MLYFVNVLTVITCVAGIPLFGNSKIVGGEDASQGDVPHIVSLRVNGRHSCGGSILKANFVLTAAHCVRDFPINEQSVQYGVMDITSATNVVAVESITIFPNFDPQAAKDDIAIVKVASPMALDGVKAKAVILPDYGEEIVVDEIVLVAGWGGSSYNGPTKNHLQKVELTVVSDDDCESSNSGRPRREYNMCAVAAEGSKGPCTNDSGGPVTADGVQLGVVSYGGNPCGVEGEKAVFTKVASFVDWINAHI